MSKKHRLAFAAILTHLREQAGLSKYRLAQLAGIPRETLSNLESGAPSPSWDVVQRLSLALGVKAEAFWTVDELPKPPEPGKRGRKGKDQ